MHINAQQFLQSLKSAIPQKKRLLIAAAAAIGLIALFYIIQIAGLYASLRDVQKNIGAIQAAAAQKDWDATGKILTDTREELADIENSLARLYPFTVVPAIYREVSAARNIVAAGVLAADAGLDFNNWLSELPLWETASDATSFSALAPEQKKQLLASVAASKNIWEKIGIKTKRAGELLASAKGASSVPYIAGKVDAAITQFEKTQVIFTNLQPLLAILPSVAGHPAEKNYLILLQNNTELRPTGGFIGTYGILRIDNGEIESFTTENVYNLDEPAKATNVKIPPVPLQRYIKQSQWFFRDVNWDPDFPTTAQRAIQFYRDEGGLPSRIDGVIALTPTVVERLIELAGPIEIAGNRFTAENLVDILAFHVEQGFRAEGITEQNRKLIIDEIAQQLKDRLLALSFDKLRAALSVVLASLEDRQLQLYFEDKDAQSVAHAYGWSGSIVRTTGDYVMVIDANLGSLKSDSAVAHEISYTARPETDNRMRASVRITYTHTGDFDWKTTRYRTYVRVYVPKGATLLSASGNEEQISVSDEHGKTVFGTFISIEPGSSETITFEYHMPDVSSGQGIYPLYVQKQAGTRGHAFTFDITAARPVRSAGGAALFRRESSNRITGSAILDTDKTIQLLLE